ncbi:PREDICTED: E3 ubiquitin-protein ligase rnf146-like [Rhagoletis zephyria]|uniref:E3 ubiquitin-protein ligase rnf146-like n=1 Tax=Rhagoletis zephyria TaxID=28612 RepID=UPI0008113D5F|nr:PREDICTED: E3 ubiquitin-protein ligase rnf146-like [Rhagoletis zephyria]
MDAPPNLPPPQPMDEDADDDGIAQVSATSSTSEADADKCPICWNAFAHKISLPCAHEFCFLCAKGAVLRSLRCPMCRGDVPADFFDNCTINNENVNIATFDGNYHWYYEGRNGWWLFDARVSLEIEEQYQKRLTMLAAAAVASASAAAAVAATTSPIAASSTPSSSGQHTDSGVIVIDDNDDDEEDHYDSEESSDSDEEDESDDADLGGGGGSGRPRRRAGNNDSQPMDQCEVMIAGFMYTIDFRHMIQYRRDSPSRTRKIKRDQAEANTKGIAGLRGNINFI